MAQLMCHNLPSLTKNSPTRALAIPTRATTPPQTCKILYTSPDHLVLLKQIVTYLALVGDLRYRADCTRADIAFETSRLACQTHQPIETRMELLKHMICYLKHTAMHGLLFPTTTKSTRSTAHSDAYYAESADRKSTSRTVHLRTIALISYKAKKKGNQCAHHVRVGIHSW